MSTRRVFVFGFTKTNPYSLKREGRVWSASFARWVRTMSRGSSVFVSSDSWRPLLTTQLQLYQRAVAGARRALPDLRGVLLGRGGLDGV